VLDYVENPPDINSPCASLLVRVTAVPRVPAVASRTAAVELWLVEERDGQPIRSVHERIAGPTGGELSFQMFSLDYPVTDRPDSPAVQVGVSGTLRVVPAADGRLDVSVTAWRKFSYGDRWARGEGRTQTRVDVGETTALLLPNPKGTIVGSGPVAGALLDGVVPRDGAVAIDLARLLAGRHLALYLKVDSLK
jgi:hypothetical protein